MHTVSVAGVQLDAVEPGGERVAGAQRVLRDCVCDVAGRHRARRVVLVQHTGVCAHLVLERRRRRRHARHARQLRDADAARVPELRVYVRALRVHARDDRLPPRDLLGHVQPRNSRDRAGLRCAVSYAVTLVWGLEWRTSTLVAIPSESIKPPGVARWL